MGELQRNLVYSFITLTLLDLILSLLHMIHAEEMAHVLSDRDYMLKYKSDLKDAILRGRARPGALLEGFQVCIGAHVQPSAKTLTAIVTAAGGQVTSIWSVKVDSFLLFCSK